MVVSAFVTCVADLAFAAAIEFVPVFAMVASVVAAVASVVGGVVEIGVVRHFSQISVDAADAGGFAVLFRVLIVLLMFLLVKEKLENTVAVAVFVFVVVVVVHSCP